ncbi:hypothetical protein ACFLU5_02700 [Bacteroidota bacterium]
MKRIYQTVIFSLFALFVSTQPLKSQSEQVIFQNDVAIAATLKYDFRILNKTKETEEEVPAQFGIYLPDSTYIEKPVNISIRGGYRKAKCTFTPIHIYFKGSGFEQDGWKDLGKVKLIRMCKSSANYNQLVIREWLVYRIYNLFTDKSYQTCLLNITMYDTGSNKKPLTTYAFLQEETDKLAERMNTEEVEPNRVLPHEFDAALLNLISVFEYMIGNLDWSAIKMHNVRTFMPTNGENPLCIPVPYDFDFSGIVNASYASPPPELAVESVRERLFRGLCRPKNEYLEVFEMLKEKKDEIYALIDNCPYLVKSHRKDMKTYLEQFYFVINSEKQSQREIFDNCR